MARLTVVLNKENWNAPATGTLHQGRNSGYEPIESGAGLGRPFNAGNIKNGVLNVDHDNCFVRHSAYCRAFLIRSSAHSADEWELCSGSEA